MCGKSSENSAKFTTFAAKFKVSHMSEMKEKQCAVLFDLDGVLLDSEGLYTIFWERMEHEYPTGIPQFASYIKGSHLARILSYFESSEVRQQVLDKLLAKNGRELTCMVQLEVPKDELVRRLLERAKIQGRADDNEVTINNRLLEYNNKTKPVADYYAAQGKQRIVDGLGTIDEVFDKICALM